MYLSNDMLYNESRMCTIRQLFCTLVQFIFKFILLNSLISHKYKTRSTSQNCLTVPKTKKLWYSKAYYLYWPKLSNILPIQLKTELKMNKEARLKLKTRLSAIYQLFVKRHLGSIIT